MVVCYLFCGKQFFFLQNLAEKSEEPGGGSLAGKPGKVS
jgi:hypothetical protein